MNKKLVQRIFGKKFLSEEEFLKKIKPKDTTSYGEIKKIYKAEFLPEEVFEPIDLENLTVCISPPRKGKNGFYISIGKPLRSFLQFSEAYYTFRCFFTDAFRDSHIEAPDYKTVLILKMRALQGAWVWWLILREKFLLFLAEKLNIEEKRYKEFKKTANEKLEYSSHPLARRISSLIKKLETYRITYKQKTFIWDGQTYRVTQFANDIKHNHDLLSTIINDDLLWTGGGYKKYERLFYDLLSGLLNAFNDYIRIVNEFLHAFRKYDEMCLRTGIEPLGKEGT